MEQRVRQLFFDRVQWTPCFTLVALLVALRWGVYPSLLQSTRYASQQWSLWAEHPDSGNYGEPWILELEKVTRQLSGPPLAIAVWNEKARPPYEIKHLRMRLAYFMCPAPIFSTTDLPAERADLLYYDNSLDGRLEDAGLLQRFDEFSDAEQWHHFYRKRLPASFASAPPRTAESTSYSQANESAEPAKTFHRTTPLHMVLLLCGLLLCECVGFCVILAANLPAGWGWRTPFIAFAVGSAIITMGLAGLSLCRIPLNLATALAVPFLVIAVSCSFAWLRRRPVNRGARINDIHWRSDFGFLLLVGFAMIATTCLGEWMTLSLTMNGIPDMGIWGYKAKLFFLERKIDSAILRDAGRSFCEPQYPLYLSLLSTWFYEIFGRIDDHGIRALQPVFTSLTLGYTMLWLREKSVPAPIAALLPAAFLLNGPLFDCNFYFMAEPALLMFAVLGGTLFYDCLSTCGPQRFQEFAGFLLGACGWVKQEGVIIWISMGIVLLTLRRGLFSSWLLGGLLFVFPWNLFVLLNGGGDDSFDFFRARNLDEMWKTFSLTVAAAWDSLGTHGIYLGCIWILTPFAFILNKAWKRSKASLLLWSASVYTTAMLTTYMFSTEPIEWHLRSSITRVLFVPTVWMLLWVGLMSSTDLDSETT